jgi:hypothetical protein
MHTVSPPADIETAHRRPAGIECTEFLGGLLKSYSRKAA